MPHANIPDLDRLIYDGAIKLEITRGIPTWEAFPGIRHQETIDLIRASIKPQPDSTTGCACAHYSDVLIRFQDGSLKRPDIAIFCARPPRQDEALTMIPQAVIEVVSPGYEYKDLSLNPQFYMAQGVLDVVIVDPRSGVVTHYRTTQVSNLRAPVTLELLCGCVCVIPE
ncbi:MAG TPA: Uma2 family endonuclease [Chloroflexia bacterium]|jgi:Uma2 family endonuclease